MNKKELGFHNIEQTKKCSKCKQIKPFLEFNENKPLKYGLHSWCRVCCKEDSKLRYIKNKEKINKRTKTNYINYRMTALLKYSNPPMCTCCGETQIKFLEIDHINGGGNEHRKTMEGTNIYLWLKKNNYPEGFQVLCSNCNMAKGRYGICPHKEGKNNDN